MSENIINRIQLAKTLGNQFFESASLKQKKNEFNSFSPHFQNAQVKLTETVKLAQGLSSLGKKANYDLGEIKDALVTVKNDLDNGSFNPWNAEKLKNAAKKAEADCNDEWKKYIRERIGGTTSILQTIKSLVSEENEYKELKRAENKIYTEEPCGREAIDAIESYLKHFNRLIESIDLDEEVLAFMRELTKKGSVPLSSLSHTCFDKLSKEKFNKKLRITIVQ